MPGEDLFSHLMCQEPQILLLILPSPHTIPPCLMLGRVPSFSFHTPPSLGHQQGGRRSERHGRDGAAIRQPGPEEGGRGGPDEYQARPGPAGVKGVRKMSKNVTKEVQEAHSSPWVCPLLPPCQIIQNLMGAIKPAAPTPPTGPSKLSRASGPHMGGQMGSPPGQYQPPPPPRQPPPPPPPPPPGKPTGILVPLLSPPQPATVAAAAVAINLLPPELQVGQT